MDKIIESFVHDPLSKIVVLFSLVIAGRYFKKYSDLIESKVEKIADFESKIDSSIGELDKAFKVFSQSISKASDKIRDEFYELKSDLVNYQDDVLKRVQKMELDSNRDRIKSDNDMRDSVFSLEKKVKKLDEKQGVFTSQLKLFTKRIAREFKDKDEESIKAKEAFKKVFEGHKKELEKQSLVLKEIENKVFGLKKGE